MDTEELFNAYRHDVYRLAVSYTKSPQDAEDVCQTVFLKLLEQRSLRPGSEKAWLFKVTANLCRSLLRSQKRHPAEPLDDAVTAPDAPGSGVLSALMELAPKYRVVVYLHYYEGMPAKDIARLLKLTTTGVTTRLSRARDMLKERLKEE